MNQIGFTDLKKWLRHRHPMILIDRVTDYEPKKSLSALLSVSGALDCVAGHFPERAIYPGTNLIQGFAQSGIILYQLSTAKLEKDEITLIGDVQARFYSMVVPGDQVIFRLKCDRLEDHIMFYSCSAFVEKRRVGAFKGSIVKKKLKEVENSLW